MPHDLKKIINALDCQCLQTNSQKGGAVFMKRQILSAFGRLLMLVAVVYASSPCAGKVYDPMVPEEFR